MQAVNCAAYAAGLSMCERCEACNGRGAAGEPDDIFFGIVQRGAAMIMFKHVGVDPVPNYTRDVKKGIARWDAYLHVREGRHPSHPRYSDRSRVSRVASRPPIVSIAAPVR